MKLGCHVGMSGKEMFLGSVREAVSYGANTFMVYTGAPQNTRRKEISELRIAEAHDLMKAQGITEFVVHAPYIINLGNSVSADTYRLAVDFLTLELERTQAMGASTLVLHPGAHVGAGEEAGLAQVIQGLNEVFDRVDPVNNQVKIALETMAGKGSELGYCPEHMARIYDGVRMNNRLRLCLDTCHLNDAGYPVREDFSAVLEKYTRYFALSQIACIHLNDSCNPEGAKKDRHANLGLGTIGFDALYQITQREEFADTPIILETPYISADGGKSRDLPPYQTEIEMLKQGVFYEDLLERIRDAYTKQ